MKTELDRIDYQILAALQKNARLSNKELAAHVGLAPSSCHTRVRRLEERNVLRGYRADVDPAVAGIGIEALISVRLHHHSEAIFETFRESMLARREVLGFFHLAGHEDFLVHVAVADANHLRSLAWEAFTAREEVSQIHASLLYEYTQNPVRLLPEKPPKSKKRRSKKRRKR